MLLLLLSLLAAFDLPSAAEVTPLSVAQFELELKNHPNQSEVSYVLEGLSHGFKVGFSSLHVLKSSPRNKPSAYEHPGVIDKYLANEVKNNRVAGPFGAPPLPDLHISSFGVIPKKGQPGKWRLILDLSSPIGSSVNDGIDADSFSLHYVKLQNIIGMIAKFGPGALIAKFDIETAYRNIPIHPDDRHLLGMKWRGCYYVDLALPFGLRSAPFIFDSVASLVEWIFINNHEISDVAHYLDDFIIAGPPGSTACAQDLAKALISCKQLGLPLHPDKLEGPCTHLTVLGILLDSESQTARLPDDKLSNLPSLIDSWLFKKHCNKHELESLIGHLHHAAKFV